MNETPVATAGTESKLSFKPENFAADMAALAKEQGVSITPEVKAEVSAPVVTPTTPVQPEPIQAQATVTPEATKPIAVPEKFQNPDGTVNVAAVEKSTANAEEALAKYLEKEKELKRKINEVKAKENTYINPPAAIAPTPEIQVNMPFAQKLEEDIKNQGAGVVLAKLFTAAQEAAEEKLRGEIDGLKMVNSENATRSQVEAIGKKDPWVYTPEGMATLTKTLEDQPYLLQAQDPYKAAYLFHKGMQNVVSQPNSQVLTPTPIARTSAPVPTVQAANPASVQPVIKLETKEDIDKHLRTLTPAQQEEFFKKAGFPAFNSR